MHCTQNDDNIAIEQVVWSSTSHTRYSPQPFEHIPPETLGRLVKTVQLTNHTTNKKYNCSG